MDFLHKAPAQLYHAYEPVYPHFMNLMIPQLLLYVPDQFSPSTLGKTKRPL
jgi:hypothetical protein